MIGHVLDASAIMAIINREPGAEIVENYLEQSIMSSVNMAETLAKMQLGGWTSVQAENDVSNLIQNIIPFDKDFAMLSARMIKSTKPYGLSLGDRACLATGLRLGLPVVTTDTAWKKLDLGVEVICVR